MQLTYLGHTYDILQDQSAIQPGYINAWCPGLDGRQSMGHFEPGFILGAVPEGWRERGPVPAAQGWGYCTVPELLFGASFGVHLSLVIKVCWDAN